MTARASILLGLLAACALPAPLAAQSVVVPRACPAPCAGGEVALDSVWAWANLKRGMARVFVRHILRGTPGAEGAMFFSVPPGAEIQHVTVHASGHLLAYDSHDSAAVSRRAWNALPRRLRRDASASFGRAGVVRIPLPPLLAGARLVVQLEYTEPLHPAADGTIAFSYPASAARPPASGLAFGMEVTTLHGFREMSSPTHDLRLEWGTELGPCPPRSRCGTTSVRSRRVRVARLSLPRGATRDIRVTYTPAAPGEVRDLLPASEDEDTAEAPPTAGGESLAGATPGSM